MFGKRLIFNTDKFNCQNNSMISKLKNKIAWFIRDEEATTAVEYALLLALIVIFSISAILGTGDTQKALWFDTAADIENAIVPN